MSLILVNGATLQLKISSLKFKRFALSFRGLERQLHCLGFLNHWNDCCFSLSIFPHVSSLSLTRLFSVVDMYVARAS